MNTVTISKCIAVITSVLLIIVSEFVFETKRSELSLIDFVWPPSSGWFLCIVIGVLVGEHVRRFIERRKERAAIGKGNRR